jgi:hypothetical protein
MNINLKDKIIMKVTKKDFGEVPVVYPKLMINDDNDIVVYFINRGEGITIWVDKENQLILLVIIAQNGIWNVLMIMVVN